MIPVNEPLLNGNEKKYLNECIDTGWISSEGPFVKDFEEKFAAKIGRRFAVSVCNGTAAIDIAIEALKLQKDDEIIMPTFTIISCINAIVRLGLKPVLVDSDEHTWNMSVEQIESKITKKTKAIMIVHIYGLPVDFAPIYQLAKKYNLQIIEDAAEAHGQQHKNTYCGALGNISTFSFYPNKHITTGEGGMVLTDDEDIYHKLLSLRNLGFTPPRRFVHYELGYNMRLTNLQAALGLAQLERLDEFVAIKRKMGAIYTHLLQDMQEFIQLPLPETTYAKNIYWVYGIVLKANIPMDAQTTIQKLADRGIGTRPFFYPMHKQPVFKKIGLFDDGESYPVAENLGERGFYLPSGLALKEQDMKIVVQTLKAVLEEALTS